MLSFKSFEELLSEGLNEQFSVYNNNQYFGVNTNKDSVYSLIKKLKEHKSLILYNNYCCTGC